MHGSSFRWLAFLVLVAAAGCTVDDAVVPPAPDTSPSTNPVNALAYGVVRGVVRWEGEIPPAQGPHLPRVDQMNKGVADAIILLRDLGRPQFLRWPHGPVRIEVRDEQILIVQDGHSSSIGLVRAGDEIEVVNLDTRFHAVRGRGAAMFAIPLPEANRSARRRLVQPGVITLSSAANHPAMSAYLIVVEDGLAARSNARGEFTLPGVPAGTHSVTCWLPSWKVQRKERDPASGLVARLHFEPPLERTLRVVVEAGGTSDARFTWSLADFVKKR